MKSLNTVDLTHQIMMESNSDSVKNLFKYFTHFDPLIETSQTFKSNGRADERRSFLFVK